MNYSLVCCNPISISNKNLIGIVIETMFNKNKIMAVMDVLTLMQQTTQFDADFNGNVKMFGKNRFEIVISICKVILARI